MHVDHAPCPGQIIFVFVTPMLTRDLFVVYMYSRVHMTIT